MSVLTEMILRYAKSSSKQDVARFGLRLLGYDQETIEKATDEEVWRSTEEGKHFKFETSTGEIKAGFGGKFNGKKIGTTWGAGHAKAKPSGGSGSKSGGGRYWMHRLPEEKILGAAQTVRKAKEDMQFAQKQKDRLEMMWRKGYIPVSEMEERMKAQKLDKFSPDMTPEEFVMKCQPNENKKSLVDYVGEANSWKEKSMDLLQEKLSQEEQNALTTMAFNANTKVGNVGNPEDYARCNLDAAYSTMTEEEKGFYLDMKAKACGLPDSGKKLSDYSDEFLVSVGAKEAPKEAPGQEKPDYSWYQPPRYGAGNLEAYMSDVAGEKVSYGHTYTQEEFERLNQKFVDSIAYEKLSPNKLTYYGTSAISSMRQRMGLYGQNKPTDQMAARLSDDEKRLMLDVVNRYKDPQSFLPEVVQDFDQLTFEDMEKAERNICRLNMNRFRSEDSRKPFKDYILLQEKMLTGAVPKSKEKRAEEEKAQAEAKKQEHAKKVEQWRVSTGEKKAAYQKIRDTFRAEMATANTTDKIEKVFLDSGYFMKPSNASLTGTKNVDLARVHVMAAKDVAKSMDRVLERFPFMYGEVGGIDTSERTAYASCTTMDLGQIHLNVSDEYFGSQLNLEESYNRTVEKKFHPKGTKCDAIVTHELGHSIDGWLTRNGILGSSEKTYSTRFSGLLQKRVLRSMGILLKDKDDWIQDGCSRYATKNSAEWFAECFAEAMHSPNPRPMAQEMMKQFEKILREEGLLDD